MKKYGTIEPTGLIEFETQIASQLQTIIRLSNAEAEKGARRDAIQQIIVYCCRELDKENFIIQSQEELLEIESKCRQCKYAVMTENELQALGSKDPCETCSDELSNWKAKEAKS